MKEKEFSKFLIANAPDTDLLSSLKIRYRPYICPFNEILELIGEDKSIFDIGCGSGIFLSLCAQYIKPLKMGGIEIDKKLVDNSERLLTSFNIPKFLKVYNGMDIPKEISEYKFVTLIDVLHHISSNNKKRFLKKIIGNMSKGSVLIIKDIDKSNPLVIFNKIHDLIFSKQFPQELKLKELLQILSDENVIIEKIIKKRVLIYPHYFVCLKRK